MAVNPRPRVRRAVNVEAEGPPPVPVYETKAREAFRANKAKNAAASIEKAATEECWKEMAQANPPVSRFEIVEGNQTVDVWIEEDATADEVSTEKLYGLVQSGEITLPQFVSVVKATQGDVKAKLGSNILAKVLTPKTKDPSLKIKARK